MIIQKRGATFEAAAVARITSTEPEDLTDYAILALMEHPSGTVQRLTVTVDDAEAGEYTLSATAAETALWKTGDWEAELQYTLGAVVTIGDKFIIRVKPEIVE